MRTQPAQTFQLTVACLPASENDKEAKEKGV